MRHSGKRGRLMFECPIARKVWDLVPAMAIPSRAVCNSLEDLLISCSRMTNLPPTGLSKPLYPWLLWVLWTSRNQFLFEDKSFSETEMLTKAIRAAKEWQESLPPRKQNSVSNKDNVSSNSHYQVPEVASILYSDAAWNASSLAVNIVMIII
ncbi:hypothetical protein HID58_013848 [Brassica napus]|uniref:Uncharacterized protein n=2 Tax=Brassica TaxID=3705 RepID=A0ABQ8DFK1_BRANA|nr:hypothetical protein HID58_013848 [Brassica napus]